MKRESIAMIILGAFAGFIVASFIYVPPIGGIRFFNRPIPIPRIVLFTRPSPGVGTPVFPPKVTQNSPLLQNNIKPEPLPNENKPQIQAPENQIAPLDPVQEKNLRPVPKERVPGTPLGGVTAQPPTPDNLPPGPPKP